MKVIQMETAYNGVDSAPVRHLTLSSKTSSAKNGLHRVEPLVKQIS